ncbi:hypothetical protein Caka_2502 [Coraliomargarita akajimensis DSM 45221]|uniref:Uncharacterized protein n=1 Tax=Coraliomargarita akajimensis (strain DSM 45221 / IAM 15411 / JCM 23193 / KCTC 12865 / 04OKA010-24) TaxID=583355 RepID=D5ENP2_CORAD|nr:hypothetical protein Caka_2502 [Coraliomargarita akajimensis DSM 45221]
MPVCQAEPESLVYCLGLQWVLRVVNDGPKKARRVLRALESSDVELDYLSVPA